MDHTNDHDEFWGDLPDWTFDDAGSAPDRPLRREPTRRSWRRPRPESTGHGMFRRHGAIGQDRADDAADHDHGVRHEFAWSETPANDPQPDDRRVAPPAGGVDPLLARFGAAAVVLTLMVPLVSGLTSSDDVDDLVATAADQSAAPDDDQVTAPTLIDTTPAYDAAETAPTETYLDPADLPPAVPVAEFDTADPTSDTPEPAQRGTGDEAESAATVEADADVASAIDDAADVDDRADRLRVECSIEYTVTAGDYWIGLADRSGVELDDLLRANGASTDTPLHPGTEICLPAGASTPTPTTTTATTTPPPATTAATTTTTTSTTTTTTEAPVVPVGPDEIVQIIRDVWPDDLEDRALEIAYRESRYVPTAKNYCCYGLFQIYWSVHQSWLADLGITSANQLYDPATNARAAYALYQRAGGWGPWSL